MPELLLALVTDFAGPVVDLLISSLGWNREERAKLLLLKKRILSTITDTVDYLTTPRTTLKMRRQITKQWNDLAVDLEGYAQLRQRVEGFASAIEESTRWNGNQKTALAIRLGAFKASIRKTNSVDLKRSKKKSIKSKTARRIVNKSGKRPAPKKPN